MSDTIDSSTVHLWPLYKDKKHECRYGGVYGDFTFPCGLKLNSPDIQYTKYLGKITCSACKDKLQLISEMVKNENAPSESAQG